MKIAKISLGILTVVLMYFLYASISDPIREHNKNKKIDAKIIEKLKDIRTAEIAYKDVNKVYCDNFDTLIHFVKTHQLSIFDNQKKVGSKSILDSLYSADYPINDFPKIPFSDEVFDLKTTYITKGQAKVHVFLVEERGSRKDRGPLHVGSLSEITVSGNWE